MNGISNIRLIAVFLVAGVHNRRGRCTQFGDVQSRDSHRWTIHFICVSYSNRNNNSTTTFLSEIIDKWNPIKLLTSNCIIAATPDATARHCSPPPLHPKTSRTISIKNIENDPLTREVSVRQRNCRFSDENILDVHHYYSYSACSVQCRKDKQMLMCNCTSHLMPNINETYHCDMDGLMCLNNHYEELSVVIARWSVGKKGVVCDCLPSCTEIDITIVHDTRDK